MNREMYRTDIKALVDKLEKEESLQAVYETAVICHANERDERERTTKNGVTEIWHRKNV